MSCFCQDIKENYLCVFATSLGNKSEALSEQEVHFETKCTPTIQYWMYKQAWKTKIG